MCLLFAVRGVASDMSSKSRGSLIHLFGSAFESEEAFLAPSVPMMFRFALAADRAAARLAWLYQATVISDLAILRALPTVRPRRSNSSAVIESRSMIESLTRSLRAVAVLARAFGFLFESRL